MFVPAGFLNKVREPDHIRRTVATMEMDFAETVPDDEVCAPCSYARMHDEHMLSDPRAGPSQTVPDDEVYLARMRGIECMVELMS